MAEDRPAREVVEASLSAARGGDLARLAALLAPTPDCCQPATPSRPAPSPPGSPSPCRCRCAVARIGITPLGRLALGPDGLPTG
ncbi:hypothetical protein GCM10009759_15430 [Kitasatospora saccharophila]|uniref:Uncharacterized protein n=1 Tax=Kitasatospora saccharophila TaxID=407973 RepID=A0ABN2WF79_9ACTN